MIFVTAHDQYAVRACEIAAIDYLLKPVTEERFELAFKRRHWRLEDAPYEDATKTIDGDARCHCESAAEA